MTSFVGGEFEVKDLAPSGKIEGLLAGYGNVDRHNEVFDRKAFAKSLAARQGRPLPMLLHHDHRRPVGAWKEWEDRPEGLFVKGQITTDTRDGAEAHSLVSEGAISGLSIGYLPKSERTDAAGRRCHVEVDLLEGSLVAVPSNPSTNITAVRSFCSARDIADMLHEGGMSRRKAKAAAGAAWRALHEQEIEEDEQEIAAVLRASAKRIAAIGAKR